MELARWAVSGYAALLLILGVGLMLSASRRKSGRNSQSGCKDAATNMIKEECTSGGRHIPYLAQEHLGRGNIAYRSRCKKCGEQIGFSFDQIGHR